MSVSPSQFRIQSATSIVTAILFAVPFAILFTLPTAATATPTITSSGVTSSPSLGDSFTIDLSVSDQPSGQAVAPGDFDIIFEWGQRRPNLLMSFGGFKLLSYPTIFNASAAATAGADCAASVGQSSGSCTLTFSSAIPVNQLAEFNFQYVWDPPPGFELCQVDPLAPSGTTDSSGCFPATTFVTYGERFGSTIHGEIADVSGLKFTGTAGGPNGLRAVPEPSTAFLLGLGLLALARRSPTVQSLPPT